jgi:hypothetical protein
LACRFRLADSHFLDDEFMDALLAVGHQCFGGQGRVVPRRGKTVTTVVRAASGAAAPEFLAIAATAPARGWRQIGRGISGGNREAVCG